MSIDKEDVMNAAYLPIAGGASFVLPARGILYTRGDGIVICGYGEHTFHKQCA